MVFMNNHHDPRVLAFKSNRFPELMIKLTRTNQKGAVQPLFSISLLQHSLHCIEIVRKVHVAYTDEYFVADSRRSHDLHTTPLRPT